MANEQLTLDTVLSNESPIPKDKPEAVSEPAPQAPAAPTEAKPEVPAEPKVERAKSNRKAWQDREQAAQGRVRDPETGQYVTKEDAPKETAPPKEPEAPAKPVVAAPQQEFTEKEKAFQRAMLEERGKRQELERRLAAVEAAKAQPAAAAGTTEAPKTTFWDDPEGHLARDRADWKKEAVNAKLGMAEFIARKTHTDFDEKIAVFEKILQQTPGLAQQWLSAPDPAEFAYTTGKNHMELEQAGSIDQLRAQIEKETEARVRLKLETELKDKAEALAKERAALPPSLSEARSTGTNKPVWGGPTQLDDIISG